MYGFKFVIIVEKIFIGLIKYSIYKKVLVYIKLFLINNKGC